MSGTPVGLAAFFLRVSHPRLAALLRLAAFFLRISHPRLAALLRFELVKVNYLRITPP